jgi:hypothetical protein
MATGGYVAGLSGLTAGSVQYLDYTTAGALTTTDTRCPVLLADTATSGVLMAMNRNAAVVNGLSLPLTFLKSAITAGTSSFTVPSAGILYFWLLGAGGGGCAAGLVGTVGYIAPSSGGSPTGALVRAYGGGGGGCGFLVYGAVAVASGDTINYTVGAGGATGSPGADGGSTSITRAASGYNAVAYGGGGGGRAGGRWRGGATNASIGFGTGSSSSTSISVPGTPGGNGDYTLGISGTVVTGGLGGAFLDSAGTTTNGGGGSGEKWTIGTGAGGDHDAGGAGSLYASFTAST